MNYFELYEQLKKTNDLIPIGSIWTDQIGKVRVVKTTSRGVFYFCYISNELHNDVGYPRELFIEHFKRIS
jgi:hypothetical protein